MANILTRIVRGFYSLIDDMGPEGKKYGAPAGPQRDQIIREEQIRREEYIREKARQDAIRDAKRRDDFWKGKPKTLRDTGFF